MWSYSESRPTDGGQTSVIRWLSAPDLETNSVKQTFNNNLTNFWRERERDKNKNKRKTEIKFRQKINRQLFYNQLIIFRRSSSEKAKKFSLNLQFLVTVNWISLGFLFFRQKQDILKPPVGLQENVIVRNYFLFVLEAKQSMSDYLLWKILWNLIDMFVSVWCHVSWSDIIIVTTWLWPAGGAVKIWPFNFQL